MLWQIWRRHRWGLSADLAYLATAPAVVALIPLEFGKKPVADVLGLVGVAVLTHLVGVFSYGFDADLVKKESVYPVRGFVLPVSNWTLTWPAIAGAAAIIAAWPLIALGVWRPCGYATPLWWPGVAVTALLGVSQALGWTPFAHHWLRLVLAVFTGGAFAAMGAIAVALFDADERLLVGAFATVWTFSFVAAYFGVGRARRGEPVAWRWLDRVGPRFARNRAALGAFRSPLRAQLWLEMRRHGWMTPIFLVTVLACVIPMLLLPNSPAVPAWRILAIVAGMPLLLAGVVATGFGKADPFQRGVLLPQFMATRPVSCGHFVAAKMLAAALSVLVSCGILLAVMLPWFFRPDNLRSFSALWQGVSTSKVVAVATLVIVYWIALSWRQLAAGMWVALSGREWVGVVSAFGFGSALICATFAGLWLSYHPDSRERLAAFTPWCLPAMLIAKIAAGSCCARQLLLRRLMSPYTVGLFLAVWCAVVASSCGFIVWLTPRDLWTRASIAQVICGVVLMIPFARLAGAPLALSFNRHR
ncbi:MAG TPA: hypothetical protein VG826_01755 [Pirellulales bacterium]|nr:hypothetical protein [Pirellulales bacterium]